MDHDILADPSCIVPFGDIYDNLRTRHNSWLRNDLMHYKRNINGGDRTGGNLAGRTYCVSKPKKMKK